MCVCVCVCTCDGVCMCVCVCLSVCLSISQSVTTFSAILFIFVITKIAINLMQCFLYFYKQFLVKKASFKS